MLSQALPQHEESFSSLPSLLSLFVFSNMVRIGVRTYKAASSGAASENSLQFLLASPSAALLSTLFTRRADTNAPPRELSKKARPSLQHIFSRLILTHAMVPVNGSRARSGVFVWPLKYCRLLGFEDPTNVKQVRKHRILFTLALLGCGMDEVDEVEEVDEARSSIAGLPNLQSPIRNPQSAILSSNCLARIEPV